MSSIDLRIAGRLKHREFRRQWFRAILENNVPEQFRDLREARSMTQSELAAATGMKQSAISRFESVRVANWKLETLLKLTDALDAQLEILVIPSEQVIARHEREEANAGWQPASIVEVQSGSAQEFNKGLTSRISALSNSEMLPPFNPGLGALKTVREPFSMSAAIAAEELVRRGKFGWSGRQWN